MSTKRNTENFKSELAWRLKAIIARNKLNEAIYQYAERAEKEGRK